MTDAYPFEDLRTFFVAQPRLIGGQYYAARWHVRHVRFPTEGELASLKARTLTLPDDRVARLRRFLHDWQTNPAKVKAHLVLVGPSALRTIDQRLTAHVTSTVNLVDWLSDRTLELHDPSSVPTHVLDDAARRLEQHADWLTDRVRDMRTTAQRFRQPIRPMKNVTPTTAAPSLSESMS